jgi:rfaE bifunctional protein kinase chain/domain
MVSSGPSEVAELLRRFASRRVLVLGDVVADEYVVGTPARISREAPVLILHHSDSFLRPGMATNTASNIAALGARAIVVGVVGDDERGRGLSSLLGQAGIDTRGLVVDSGRPTPTKTRIIARGAQQAEQQIVRIDRVDDSPVSDQVRDRTIHALSRTLDEADCVLISDYDLGVLSPAVIDACLPAALERGLPVIVDSHGDLTRFRGVTAATPNQPEVEAAAGRSLDAEDELDREAERLRASMEARGILVTRGRMGLTLYEVGRAPYRLPVALSGTSLVVDPTGAGDTVAAVFTLAVASGADMRTAAFLSNIAGGEAVRKLGAATVSCPELLSALDRSPLAAH